MLRSMTGFARCSQPGTAGDLTWEIRSVNHRYLDVQFRLPEELRPAETEFRKQVAASVGRGKVDCTFNLKRGGDSSEGRSLNREAVDELADRIAAVREMVPGLGKSDPLDVLRWPGVLEDSPLDTDALTRDAAGLLDETLDKLTRMREREGQRLRAMLTERADETERLCESVRARRPLVLEGIRARLDERLARLDHDADPARLETEIVLIAQKLDVDEELDRLGSHLRELRDVLDRDEPVGRRLDFLIQEFNREANTLASKSGDSETTRAAVDMKVLVEQMREQVQNVE